MLAKIDLASRTLQQVDVVDLQALKDRLHGIEDVL